MLPSFSLSIESSFIPGKSYRFTKKELPKVSFSVSSGRKCRFTKYDIIVSAECDVEQKKERTEVDHKWDESKVDNGLDDIGDLEDDFLGFVVHVE